MKKTTIILLLLALIAGLFISCSQEVTVDADVHNKINDIDTFCINGKYFSTLQAAVDYFKDSKAMKAPGDNDYVIYLTRNASGPGADIVDIKDLVIDFAGFTYSFTNVTAIQGETGGKFGLSITDGSEVTLKGLEQINLFDSTADLTMVYIEGSDTSLTIEDAPKMVVEPTQYVFWAANGATLTIGSEDKTKEATITGRVAATGGTTEESKPTIELKSKATITGSVEAESAKISIAGESKVTGAIEVKASEVSIGESSKIEANLALSQESTVTITSKENIIQTLDKTSDSTIVVSEDVVVDNVAEGSDNKVVTTGDAEVKDETGEKSSDVSQEYGSATYVAMVDGILYKTDEIVEAVKAADEKEVVLYLCGVASYITIDTNQKVLINLGGFTANEIQNNGYLVIEGDGVVGSITTSDLKNLILQGGTYSSIPEEIGTVPVYCMVTVNETYPVSYTVSLRTNGVARIGNHYFDALKAAFDCSISGDTIDLLVNTSVDELIIIPEGTSLVLNLNGYEISNNVDSTQSYYYEKYGNTASGRAFVLLDDTSLTVNAGDDGSIIIPTTNDDSYGFFRVFGGMLTLNGGSYKGKTNNGALFHACKSSGAELLLNNLNVETDYRIVASNGPVCGTIVVNGGSYKQNNKNLTTPDGTIPGFYLSYWDATFNGVEIESDWGSCVEVCGSYLNMEGEGSERFYAKFTGNNDFRVLGPNTAQRWNCTAIAVDNNGVADIKSGSYSAPISDTDEGRGHGIYIFTSDGHVLIDNDVVISACTAVRVDNNGYPQYYSDTPSIFINNGTISGQLIKGTDTILSITGGVFDHDPSAYVVEGYYAKLQGTNPETWIVIPDTPQVSVVKNGESVGQIMSLALFRDKVNAGNTYEGYTITLLVDVDLENVAWTPIGTAEHPFSGTFDGNSKTITGLTVSANGNLGLFGVSQDSELKNFTIDKANISGSGDNSALVSGVAFRTTISGVNVINSTLNMVEGERIGGITGGNYTIIINCSVKNCSITGSEQVGAIAGYICSEPITGCVATDNTIVAKVSRAGGLVGKLDFGDNVEPATVSNNTISGTVTAPDVAGGICGQIMCGTSHVNDYSIADNSMDIECNAVKTSPIGILRSGQPTDFTGTMATKITGNKWTARTYNMNTYTYTAEETGTTAQVIDNAL